MHNIKEFIDMNEKDFDSFFNILDNSFPKSERRDYPSQKDLLSISNYRPFVFKENDEVLALMAVWEFNDFVYVEHLAVDIKLRGKGVGTSLIKNYLNKCDKKVFLEVEPPNCDTSPFPPTKTSPSLTSYKRDIKLTKLDLDEPVPPIIPTVSPDFM